MARGESATEEGAAPLSGPARQRCSLRGSNGLQRQGLNIEMGARGERPARQADNQGPTLYLPGFLHGETASAICRATLDRAPARTEIS